MLVIGQNLQPSIINRPEGCTERVPHAISVVVFTEKGNFFIKVQFPIGWHIEIFFFFFFLLYYMHQDITHSPAYMGYRNILIYFFENLMRFVYFNNYRYSYTITNRYSDMIVNNCRDVSNSSYLSNSKDGSNGRKAGNSKNTSKRRKANNSKDANNTRNASNSREASKCEKSGVKEIVSPSGLHLAWTATVVVTGSTKIS